MTQESFLKRYSFPIMMIILVMSVLTILIVGTWWNITTTRESLQKIINDENSQLDKVKGDCKSLGKWIIDQGANPLNLDPVLDKATKLYMVNCK